MKRTITFISLLLLALPLSYGQNASKGQWSGAVSLDMGTNFKEGISSRLYSNSSGSFTAYGSYSTDKFMIRVDLQALPEFTAASVVGQTINIKDQSAPQLNYDVSQKENTIFAEKAGIQMKYIPDPANTFSFNVKQSLDRQMPNKADISIKNILIVEEGEFERMETRCSFDIEEGDQTVRGWSTDAKWHHRFDKPGREIDLGLGWSRTHNDKSSNWHIFPTTDVFASGEVPTTEDSQAAAPEQMYRITPIYTNNSLNASMSYRDVDLFDIGSLNLELGMGVGIGFDKDHLSAANYINDTWVDSLEYRENFNYFSLDMTPRAKLSYSPGRFDFNLQLTPDFYINRLDSDGNIGGFNFNKVYMLPDLNASWTPSEMHRLGLSYRQSLSRPSYTQICWFQRAGSYANELQMGNPELKPSSKGKLALSYTFHSGFFTGILEGMTAFTWDNIEKVFNTTDEFRIYTWINSGHSTDNSIKLSMKADLKNFQAMLGGYYNYFIGYNNAGNATRSSDWGLNGSATLKVRGGWIFNVNAKYQSNIIRTYSSITEYVRCDARVTKEFKRFSLFVQGRDLFDSPIEIATYSEDQTYARVEETNYNRRIFSIGTSFKF